MAPKLSKRQKAQLVPVPHDLNLLHDVIPQSLRVIVHRNNVLGGPDIVNHFFQTVLTIQNPDAANRYEHILIYSTDEFIK